MLLRFGGRIAVRRYTTGAQVPRVNPEDMKIISKMPFYRSFQEGVDLTHRNQLEEANQRYQSALNQLQQRRERMMDHYIHIQKKIIQNNYALRKGKTLQDSIYALIKVRKQAKTNPALVYDDYSSLFAALLEFNPHKAALLGKALLSEGQSESLPLKHRKEFQFSLGNAYLLLGNYTDAKIKYSQCLENDPSRDLKVRLMNNLGLACWWHKNPLQGSWKDASGSRREELVDSEFGQAREILLKAVQTGENLEQIQDSERQQALRQALKEQQLDSLAFLSKKESVLPIFNLSQYYIHNEPHHKIKILYWLNTLLKLTQTFEQHTLLDETYTTLAVLNNQQDRLKEIVPQMVQKYRGKTQEIYFSKISIFLSVTGGDRQGATQMQSKISEAEKKLLQSDPFIFKRKYMNMMPFTL